MDPDETKTCPFCAETIKAAAIVCRYCGRDLPATPAPRSPVAPTATRLGTTRGSYAAAVVAAVWAVTLAVIGYETLSKVGWNSRPAAVAPGQTAPVDPDGGGYVATLRTPGVANLRRGPGMNFKVVRQTKPGERLVGLETKGDWHRIRGPNPDTPLWIHTRVVEPNTPVPPAPTKQAAARPGSGSGKAPNQGKHQPTMSAACREISETLDPLLGIRKEGRALVVNDDWYLLQKYQKRRLISYAENCHGTGLIVDTSGRVVGQRTIFGETLE